MLYLEYERLKTKYRKAIEEYDSILTEKEIVFLRTQPQAVNTEKERTSGGNAPNKFDDYLVEAERRRFDERIEEAKKIIDHRAYLLKCKEAELRNNKRIENEVYTMRYLDRRRIKTISKKLNYSESQIYRVLQRIKDKIEHDPE